MPCFCADPNATGDLVTFKCGHIVHSKCASVYIANRLSNEEDEDEEEEQEK